jgi:septum formation protein
VLASKSARRRALLTEHGIAHTAIDAGLDDGELHDAGSPPEHWVAALAYLKARSGASAWLDEHRGDPAIVLGADTVCVKDNDIIGQPENEAAARATLERLSGGAHRVLTGVALVRTHAPGRDVFVVGADVRVGDLGEHRIAPYLASGEWRGKAGAYNLFERLDAGWPIAFEGDPLAIVGLPIAALRARLAAFSASTDRA